MPFNFNRLVAQYYKNVQDDNYPRLRGWEFLWDYVQDHEKWKNLILDKNIEKTALHLGFYLANWGMFRGSSGLLNTNFDFFKDLSHYLLNKIPLEFWELTFRDFSPDTPIKHKVASKLFDEAIACIELFECDRITWTETLKSKILLGLWGQCPALDTFHSRGLNQFLIENPNLSVTPKGKINSKSLSCLNVVFQKENWQLDNYQTHYGKHEYPPGKLIDMAFFQYGWNNS